MNDCACPPECPARCTPGRLCDDPACPCYLLWSIETDEMQRQTARLSPAELHQLAREAWE